MAVKTISRENKLGQSAEKQMRNWEIARCQHPESAQQVQVAEFVTVANVVGVGGNEVAAALGRALGWPVYDRELLTRMAGDDEARASLYHSMDERDLGWLEGTLRSLMEQSFRMNDYFHRLVETALCLARQRPTVFVGRAADLILPKSKGLRVKLIASLEYCALNFAERNGVPLRRARAEVGRIEGERAAFIRNHFHIEASDPTRFDLLINVERFSIGQTVDLILAAHAKRIGP